jgi:hypothetical protein
MPKTSNYANCKFYRLVCRDPAVKDCYVGHTCDEVKRRYNHKTRCTKEKGKKYNLHVYEFIRQHGSWDNWSLIVHETLAVKNKNEAAIRERYWLEHYKATLNSNIPSQKQAEYGAKYRVENHDKIKETSAKYCAGHRKEQNQRSAAWYLANKVHLQEKHNCPCGSKFTTANRCAHLRTARHCTFITAQAAL